MSKQIDLVAYRSELQSKIDAIDLLLGHAGRRGTRPAHTTSRARTPGGTGRRRMSPAAKARLAAIARARWKAAKASGRSRL